MLGVPHAWFWLPLLSYDGPQPESILPHLLWRSHNKFLFSSPILVVISIQILNRISLQIMCQRPPVVTNSTKTSSFFDHLLVKLHPTLPSKDCEDMARS